MLVFRWLTRQMGSVSVLETRNVAQLWNKVHQRWLSPHLESPNLYFRKQQVGSPGGRRIPLLKIAYEKLVCFLHPSRLQWHASCSLMDSLSELFSGLKASWEALCHLRDLCCVLPPQPWERLSLPEKALYLSCEHADDGILGFGFLDR